MADERPQRLNVFARYLTVWVTLCIAVGIALGRLTPATFATLGAWQVDHINIPVALLIWLMIIPMLIRVDFAQLSRVPSFARGLAITAFVNWAIKPFSMAVLAWFFIKVCFRRWLPADQLEEYVAGLVLLAAAPCTAMVFAWSRLCGGDPNFTLTQVAVNDTIMVFAFAPIVGLLLGVSAVAVPWDTLIWSVALYIVAPLLIAQAIRLIVLSARDINALDHLLRALDPVSTCALLATLVLLFGLQGEAIVSQPLVIGLLAVPIVLQVFLNAGIAYFLAYALEVPHTIAGPAALIGASNFFELAVAAAISVFGIRSGAALATVVGVLVEVPVMLLLVDAVKRSERAFSRVVATRSSGLSPM